MKNTDTRIQITRRLLKDSMLKLLRDKNINSITICELCDVAGLNRGTFYLHYDSPLALLKDIEREYLEKSKNLIISFFESDRETDTLCHLFQEFWQDREVFSLLIGPNGDPDFVEQNKSFMRERSLTEWKKEFPEYEEAELDFMFDFLFHGHSGLLSNWLQNDKGIPLEEFTHRMERFGYYTLMAVRDFNSSMIRASEDE